MAIDLYQAVTDHILEMLDKGTVPWRNPIVGGGGGEWPVNLDSRRRYRGINVFLLAITAWMKGYGSAYWLTFNQAAQRGANVRKGEKASIVVFWKQYELTNQASGEPKKVPVLRYYNVFNADQCEGLKPPDDPAQPPTSFEPIEAAQKIVADYTDGPTIEHGRGRQAFYRPSADLVHMPERERFISRESYYGTLFHELAHSTGHVSRLDRGFSKDPVPFGSTDYSREELVAEMGSAFLCATAGISPPTIEQAAAYIAGWRRKLGEDKKLVIAAAGAGHRATDWILGQRGEMTEQKEAQPEPEQ